MVTISRLTLCIVFGILAKAMSLPRSPMLTNFQSLQECILGYFNAGYTYKKIVFFLGSAYGVFMTVRSLRYLLNKVYGVRRRGNGSPEWLVRHAIIREINGPGKLAGYRFMTQVLRQKYLSVSRDQVMVLLRELDPEGCASRQSRRLTRRIYRCPDPNGTWHIDGYDKLKPFGFCISGCIDGYSRRVMFLEVAASNNDPKIIARYFLKCVKEVGGCPRLVQTDCGTENVLIASLQSVFRGREQDPFSGLRSHRYGTSTSNQRIEAWWSILRRFRSEWWISLFKDLASYGAFQSGNQKHVFCLQYCFMDLIQRDLDEVAMLWNSHTIRPSRMAECPSGIPDEMYFFPQNSGISLKHYCCGPVNHHLSDLVTVSVTGINDFATPCHTSSPP